MKYNPGYFTEGGRATQCMQFPGIAFVQGSIEWSNQSSSYSTIDRFGPSMPPELTHLPRQVDDSLRSYGSDIFSMGEELLWLSRVPPHAAHENYALHKSPSTDIRRKAAQVVPFFQMLCKMDPGSCQMMQSIFLEMVPILEQQIYTYARQLGD
jgi:hypothetical protein